jgi:hypothetical protein
MTRLHKKFRETALEMIDEVVFRFAIDSKEAQEVLMEVLKDRGIVNAVCVRVQLRLMDNAPIEGGAA